MRAIIEGKRYDSDKAEQIASHCWGHPGDVEHIDESLYRASKGNWFLAGRGGPKTKYARPVAGGDMSGSSDIIPLPEDDAYEWLIDEIGQILVYTKKGTPHTGARIVRHGSLYACPARYTCQKSTIQ